MTDSAHPHDSESEQIPEVDADQIRIAMQELYSQQSLLGAAVAGFVAACVGAAMWAGITVATGMQIGWIAIGIGYLVGKAVRMFGKGLEPIYGYLGGGLSLAGCLVGNLLAALGLVANDKGIPLLELLVQLDPGTIMNIMVATFDVFDLLFYGLAVIEGYRLSFRELTEQDADELMADHR